MSNPNYRFGVASLTRRTLFMLCPDCGKIASFDTRARLYYCKFCGWFEV